VKGKPAAPAAVQPSVKKPVVVPAKKKWEGEDEEESDPVVRTQNYGLVGLSYSLS